MVNVDVSWCLVVTGGISLFGGHCGCLLVNVSLLMLILMLDE